MSKQSINIWDRSFSLAVCYECYPGEKVLDEQKEALELFLDSDKAIADSRTKVEKYILKNYADEVKASAIENIFKYVMPKSLYVPHDNHLTVAILCNFRFDAEHGLAVVFEKGKLKEIGTQDIIL